MLLAASSLLLVATLGSDRGVVAQELLHDDPLALCSEGLRSAWRDLAAGQREGVALGVRLLTDDRRCRIISTQAESDYLRGRLALLDGAPDEAARAFEAALAAAAVRHGDRPSTAEVRYYAGLAREALDEPAAARAHYLELAREFPADARTALVLPLLEHAAASTPEERLGAALQAVDTHNYTAAERLLTRIVADAVGERVEPGSPAFATALRGALAHASATTLEATYQLGYLWYYWIRRNNDRAPPLLAAIAEAGVDRSADAAYYLARSFMRAEDYEAARAAWAAFAERFPRDSRAHEATYYRGWLYLDREQFSEALPGLQAYVDDFRGGQRFERALWYLGWTHYRLRDFASARASFSRLAERSGYLEGAKGRYWEGRAFREEGNEADARRAFEDVADRYAFTWYGLLSRRALGLPLVPAREHTPPPWPRARLLELAERGGALESLAALVEVGDTFHVARYYEDRGPDARLGERDALLVRQAAGYAYADFNESRGHSHGLLRDVIDTEASLLHWMRRYPRPYDRWVVPAAEAAGIDPLLIWAHMQIESHYNTRYVSYADAQGLLQLIPRTGQNVAALIGEPYLEGMLMDPGVNVRFGASYLGALLREFGGQMPLAMCGYNSGAGSMHAWVDENHDLPFDAFVEEIPYDQSREYLKKVTGMYVHYLYMYADDAHLEEALRRLFPERIEAGYAGELDY